MVLDLLSVNGGIWVEARHVYKNAVTSFLFLKQLAKSSLLEHRIATMKQEQKSWEHQSESLKSQLVSSQEKVGGQFLFNPHG